MSNLKCDLQAVIKRWLKEIRAGGEFELDTYSGKRSEPRFYPWVESLELRYDGETFIARGENLSSQGVGVVCKHSLERGEMAEMRRVGEDVWLPIRIQHCTQTVGAYKIGAKFIL